MKEEIRKLYLEFVKGIVKLLLEISGGTWVTISGNDHSLMFMIHKTEGEDTTDLINYDITGKVIKDYAE